MNHFIFILLIILLSVSCEGTYVLVDNEKFNQTIANRTDIETPEELIELYYENFESENEISISKKNIDINTFEIVLINENFHDDSVSGVKIVMIASFKDNKWFVYEIRKNWKCWKNRGHRKWSSKPCT